MAGLCTSYNFFLTNENKFAGDAPRAPIKSNSILNPILAIFGIFTLVSAQAFILIKAAILT